jgi:hypothetical protein
MCRTFRTILVGVLVLSMSVDSATACRFFARGCCYSPCVSVCYEPCYPACCDPCCSDSCCGGGWYMTCDGLVWQEPCCTGETISAAPSPASPSQAPLTVPKPSAKTAPAPATVNKPPKPELPPAAAPEPMPGPGAAEAMPPSGHRATSQPPELPAEPSNSLFGLPPEEPPMPTDNLFGAPPQAKSTPAPAATKPAPAPTESAPAATKPAPAATPSTTPTTTPGAAAPNDLFGPSPQSQPSTPAEPGNDLFGPTSSAPAGNNPSTAPADDSTSDRYGIPDEPRADKTLPVEEAVPAGNQKQETDDLFGGFDAILREPGGLASDAMRTWVDNTGQFSCQARLIQFKDGQVRLLKDNGRTTTVPVYRLSQGDLQFVQRQASAQRADMISRTADNSQPQPVN